ncbi:NrfD/PsrC family molybdoenzyme membrane anchor subunit [Nocardiopsis baichengensis]|uniref:NrfD/PsrC family molybdoenzyme membrane anchor subunit n=1 Tax=Nocardiopsis baichengensis TaxID=280240 RepID=UPI0003605C3C|nr:NrfD/PsrC family molybdoenzyme membrane anchor subunit [Nocardiopsis baichengensis]
MASSNAAIGASPLLAAPMEPEPWGVILAVYFSAVGLPSGIALAGLWYGALAPEDRLRTEWRTAWAGLAMLVLAGAALTIDLGRPERFFLMITRFENWSSPISLGAKLLALKGLLLVMVLYFQWRRAGSFRAASRGRGIAALDRTAERVDQALRWAVMVVSVALALYPAAVLSWTWVSPLGAAPGALLIFLSTSLLMGVAAFELLNRDTAVRDGPHIGLVRSAPLVLLVVYAVALLFTVLAARESSASPAVDDALSGAWAPLSYYGVLGAGIAAPMLLLASAPRSRWARATSALLIIAGAGLARFTVFAV